MIKHVNEKFLKNVRYVGIIFRLFRTRMLSIIVTCVIIYVYKRMIIKDKNVHDIQRREW